MPIEPSVNQQTSTVGKLVERIDAKINQSILKNTKPSINAIAQGFQPSPQSLASHVNVIVRKQTEHVHCQSIDLEG
jgi:hypothetical protein